MIALAFFLAAAAPQTAVDAERAFAAAAQTEGQWTAFRRFAAPDGLMFTPAPVNAREFLKDRPDPPQAVMWWPGRSWVSCDGEVAVNTGPWLREGGKQHGTFTTVWRRQADGSWLWLNDNGRETPSAVPARDTATVARSACGTPASFDPSGAKVAEAVSVQWEGRMPATGAAALPDAAPGEILQEGASPDGTLHWQYLSLKRLEDKAFGLRVWQWDGKAHNLVLYEISGLAAQ